MVASIQITPWRWVLTIPPEYTCAGPTQVPIILLEQRIQLLAALRDFIVLATTNSGDQKKQLVANFLSDRKTAMARPHCRMRN